MGMKQKKIQNGRLKKNWVFQNPNPQIFYFAEIGPWVSRIKKPQWVCISVRLNKNKTIFSKVSHIYCSFMLWHCAIIINDVSLICLFFVFLIHSSISVVIVAIICIRYLILTDSITAVFKFALITILNVAKSLIKSHFNIFT